jgi:hypothetical protein
MNTGGREMNGLHAERRGSRRGDVFRGSLQDEEIADYGAAGTMIANGIVLDAMAELG